MLYADKSVPIISLTTGLIHHKSPLIIHNDLYHCRRLLIGRFRITYAFRAVRIAGYHYKLMVEREPEKILKAEGGYCITKLRRVYYPRRAGHIKYCDDFVLRQLVRCYSYTTYADNEVELIMPTSALEPFFSTTYQLVLFDY